MKFFSASIDKNIEKIDLHDFKNSKDALDFLEKELFNLYSENKKYCKIIHGIGEGVLLKRVHDFLDKQSILELYKVDETGGATIVIFNY